MIIKTNRKNKLQIDTNYFLSKVLIEKNEASLWSN